MDARKNFAFGTLAAGINNAATTLSVGAGEGARFPVAPFNAVIWNRTDYISPAHAYQAGAAEIVRVTGIAVDTLTITRAQEGTAAKNLNSAGKVYEIWAGPTVKLFDRLQFDNSAMVLLRDDFLGGKGGELNWTSRAIGSGATSTTNDGDVNHPGGSEIRTGTSGGGYSLELKAGAASGNYFKIDGTTVFEWCYSFMIYTSLSGVRMRLGFARQTDVVPSTFLGIRYDTDPTYGDTTFKLNARASFVDTDADFGIAPVMNTWYFARIWSFGDGKIRASINNGTEVQLSTGLPSGLLLSLTNIMTSGNTTESRLVTDFISFYMEGIVR
jgi:hypothetical protein